MKLMTRKKGPIPPIIIIINILLQFSFAIFLKSLSFNIKFLVVLGWFLIPISLLTIFVCLFEFRKNKTTFVVFKQPAKLITYGLYSYSRNPMYLGMLMMLIAIALILNNIGSILLAFLFIPIMKHRIILHEEMILMDEFPSDYKIYKTNTRRWI
jgi:protein-S-isoprenylcysteine O-methyltransferase Ste14